MTYLGRPFVHTGQFWGAALVACVVAPFGYSKLLPLEAPHLTVLAAYLVAAAGVAAMAAMIRRWLRPPRAVAERMFIDVTAGGIWNETPASRTLLLAAPEIARASLYWNRHDLVRIVLHADRQDLEMSGLADMVGFVDDLRKTFVRLKCVDIHVK